MEAIMPILQMRQATAPSNAIEVFNTLNSSMPGTFRPLIAPTLASQADILGFPVDTLRRRPPRRVYEYELAPASRSMPQRAELFTDGTSLFVVTLVEQEPVRRSRARGTVSLEAETHKPPEPLLQAYYIGLELNSPRLGQFEQAINQAFGVELKPFFYSANRFEELIAEGRAAPSAPSATELESARALCNRATRALAIAIKASGGLLVRDLAKQLPADARDRTDDIQSALRSVGLVGAEIVVVCSKTQAQTARVPSMEILQALSKQGLKCACGRPVTDERIEEALTITELGRTLLDRSRWLTIILLDELAAVGVPIEKTLIEHQAGGDEMDLLADVSGELVFFELKDKEFNLGNAYSFEAKIGIIQPNHPVIVSTEHVGNDAKDHFQRARLARAPSPSTSPSARYYPKEEATEIKYTEGLENLQGDVRQLASAIYGGDATRILSQVLAMASLDARSLIEALEASAVVATQTPTKSTGTLAACRVAGAHCCAPAP